MGLGLDRHPELLPVYFGNYRRLVYLAQTDDPGPDRTRAPGGDPARAAFERRETGLGELGTRLAALAGDDPSSGATGSMGDATGSIRGAA